MPQRAVGAVRSAGESVHSEAPPHADSRADADAAACFRRALAGLGGIVVPHDPASCLVDLHAAACAAHTPALRGLGMAWARAGDESAASACFAAALAEGDALAAFLLARLSADPRDAAAFDAHAAAHGIVRAGAFLESRSSEARPLPVPASTIPPPPPSAVLALGQPPPTVHRERPFIATFDDVLDPLECEYVIGIASGRVQRSLVHDPATGGPMLHPMRTSHSMTFTADDDDFWLRQLQRRLAALTGMPFAQAEPLAVLRYARGEEYRPHRDYLRDPAELAADAPGQRLRTVFVYLSDVAAGGETDFPLLGVRIAPRRGRVVLFDNVGADGSPDPDTLHAGLPVERGRKWLATLWMRERSLRTA